MHHIPYDKLTGNFGCLLFGAVPYTVHLCPSDPERHCVLTLPEKFRVVDSPLKSALRVPLGGSFVLEYRGQECEVRVGRRILVRDA